MTSPLHHSIVSPSATEQGRGNSVVPSVGAVSAGMERRSGGGVLGVTGSFHAHHGAADILLLEICRPVALFLQECQAPDPGGRSVDMITRLGPRMDDAVTRGLGHPGKVPVPYCLVLRTLN
ncbi:hypothetical protein SKAU_G00049110 [Synaphobranchus kaupii]|uniref:Uncharacterized protein n=1 Tax=Synaphobranchus kaupii TaxID=118154 RepID=A0A9Q1G3I7_SYNKA|nr:hypothetical protein SKAU_G00049110 [Synaphobranchus kaupii]